MKKYPARLYALVARNAPVAVILRRGPTKQVRLIKWNLMDDTFELGQWFKGRIYERRCDLSPDGALFVYFAATHKAPMYTWTAISRPPYLTALALWPKGDCWHGGGWFISETELKLNHGSLETDLHAPFRPGPLTIDSEHDCFGELGDNSVWSPVRRRDGWIRIQRGKLIGQEHGWDYEPAEIWTKRNPNDDGVCLRMEVLGIGSTERSWYRIRYRVTALDEEERVDLGICDWADWDRNRGDLLFAKDGCVFRQKISNRELPPVLLADFNDQTFCEIPPSEAAKEWP
jgi:hypothetical protein